MTMDELHLMREQAKRLNRVNREIERLRSFVQRTSPNLDGMPHSGQQMDAMANYMAKVDQWLDERNKISEEIMDEILILSEGITGLKETTANIMWGFSVEGKPIRVIAKEQGYTDRQCYNHLSAGRRIVTKTFH